MSRRPGIISFMNEELRGKRVTIVGNDFEASGVFVSADSHMNVLLDRAVVRDSDREASHGRIVVRGANIRYVVIHDDL